MIRINLLPYRKARRQKQIVQHLSYVVAVVVVIVVIIVGLDTYIGSALTDLQEQRVQLQQQNSKLLKKIGKLKGLDKLRSDVESKLALVDRLQAGRFETLMILHEVAKLIPENVWFSSSVNTGAGLQYTGYAESNKAVANFMRALDQSKLFDHVALQVIQRQMINGMPVRSFKLTVGYVAGVSVEDLQMDVQPKTIKPVKKMKKFSIGMDQLLQLRKDQQKQQADQAKQLRDLEGY
ncbi:MAG: PilN domain-containing protein [Zetaproteobacteria bacterium]|nr:PilN domain-containing protein [Zetaproteobacteria bacterium]